MIIVHGLRQVGKTAKLIEMAALGGEIIVCQDPYQVMEIAQTLGKTISRPINYSRFTQGKMKGCQPPGYLIDDIELLLTHLSYGIKVAGFSMQDDHQGLRVPVAE